MPGPGHGKCTPYPWPGPGAPPLGLASTEGLGVGRERCGARLSAMNARANDLLDEVLDLPAEDRSAVVLALIDSLEGDDHQATSDAWRSELLRRRDRLRSGAVKAAPWAEARARMLEL